MAWRGSARPVAFPNSEEVSVQEEEAKKDADEVLSTLLTTLRDENVPQNARTQAAKAVFDRAWGRIPSVLESVGAVETVKSVK